MLIHVGGGCEHSIADVAPMRSYSINVGGSPAPIHHHTVDSLQVDIEVASLGVAPAADVAMVRSLMGMSPHVSVQQRGDGELFSTGGAGEREHGRRRRGGRRWRHSWGGRGPGGRRYPRRMGSLLDTSVLNHDRYFSSVCLFLYFSFWMK